MEIWPFIQKVLLCCGLAGIVFSPLSVATVIFMGTMMGGD